MFRSLSGSGDSFVFTALAKLAKGFASTPTLGDAEFLAFNYCIVVLVPQNGSSRVIQANAEPL